MTTETTPPPTVEQLSAQMTSLRNELIEQDHRWVPIVRRLMRRETWQDESMRMAALTALLHRVITPSAVVLSVGALGGLMTAGVALYQVLEMKTQTTVMQKTAKDQFDEMRAQTAVMKEADAAQRRTELIQLFYGKDLPAPIRSMAVQELLAMKVPYLVFTDANLSEVRVTQTDFSDLDMTRSNLTGARLSGAKLKGTKLIDATVEKTTFGNGSVEMTAETAADLTGAQLTLSKGSSTDFTMGFLMGAEFRGAKLIDADFSNTTGSFINAASESSYETPLCNLPGRAALQTGFDVSSGGPDSGERAPVRTDFSGATFWNSTWGAANLMGVVLAGAKIGGARFTGASLHNADFSRSDWDRGIVACAHARAVKFDGAKLSRVDFSGADLEMSSWREANAQKLDFTGAKLMCADFTGLALDPEGDSVELTLAGADLRQAKGLTAEHWKHACIDAKTRLPEDAPKNLPACAPVTRPRTCTTAKGGPLFRVGDLIEIQHFQTPAQAGVLWEYTKKRNMEVESD